MNKTYKVARSLTRGTVVTSEAASSRQGKALKMVVAAVAAAFVGGVAMAEEAKSVEVTQEYVAALVKAEKITLDKDVVTFTKGATASADLTVTVADDAKGLTFVVGGGTVSNAGTVNGNGAKVAVSKGTVNNTGTINFGNGATVTIGGGESEATVANTGTGLMNFGNSTVTIDKNGTLTTAFLAKLSEEQKATNVGAVFSGGTLNLEKDGKLYVGDNSVLAGATFNLKGGEFKKDANTVLTGVTIGDADAASTTVNFLSNYSVGALTVENAKVTVADGATLTATDTTVENATIDNKGTLDFGENKVTLNAGGVLNTAIDGVTLGNLELNEGGVFNIAALNDTIDANAKAEAAKDRLLLTGKSTYTLNGGDLRVAGVNYSQALAIGTTSGGDTTKLTISSGSYKFSDVLVNAKGALNVGDEGALTVNNLTLNGNATVAAGGSLTVDGILSASAGNTLTVNKKGNVTTSARNLFKTSEGNILWGLASDLLTVDKLGFYNLNSSRIIRR